MIIRKNIESIENCIRVFSYRNKHDLLSNEIVRWIFDLVKNEKQGEYFKDNIWIEIVKTKHKIPKSTFDNFNIRAETKNEKIYISIFIYDEFSEKDYKNFNYILYEIARHELEHIDRFVLNKRPDEKYVEIYNRLLSSVDLEEHAELVSQYILSNTEIDSYVKSIMYVSKKQNVSALDIIEKVLKRAFFNNDSELMKQGMNNSNIRILMEKTRNALKNKIIEYYPRFEEKWL